MDEDTSGFIPRKVLRIPLPLSAPPIGWFARRMSVDASGATARGAIRELWSVAECPGGGDASSDSCDAKLSLAAGIWLIGSFGVGKRLMGVPTVARSARRAHLLRICRETAVFVRPSSREHLPVSIVRITSALRRTSPAPAAVRCIDPPAVPS